MMVCMYRKRRMTRMVMKLPMRPEMSITAYTELSGTSQCSGNALRGPCKRSMCCTRSVVVLACIMLGPKDSIGSLERGVCVCVRIHSISTMRRVIFPPPTFYTIHPFNRHHSACFVGFFHIRLVGLCMKI